MKAHLQVLVIVLNCLCGDLLSGTGSIEMRNEKEY